MRKSPYQHYYDYLTGNVLTPFYNKRLEKLNKITLEGILKLKNPYLFKAKNLELAGDLVKAIVDAYLSSQEETLFGNLLETFAIHLSETLDGGFKSKLRSVDLEFERGEVYYIVEIKSSTNWGNSTQVIALKNNFKAAKEILRKRGVIKEIIAVNGCMYGKDNQPLKNKVRIKGAGAVDEEADKIYYKLAGQDFWKFISGDDDLYREIITPIDIEAKDRDETFKAAYAAKVNEMTQEFMLKFISDNRIDWLKLIDHVSKREPPREKSQPKKRREELKG